MSRDFFFYKFQFVIIAYFVLVCYSIKDILHPEAFMRELTYLQQKILKANSRCELRLSEPMRKHTSFRIGGDAEVMAFPKNTEELKEILDLSRFLDCHCRILGAGTNVLAPDEGLEGIVICLKNGLDTMEQLDENRILVGAGVTMTRCALFAASLGLSGLEFAHGIPGTVGGGVYMNAGAYGGEICQVCESVTAMDLKGNIKNYTGAEMDFSYRHSALEDSGEIVLSAVFTLGKAPVNQIKDKMKELSERRKASQPLDLPSAGSAFKRPSQGYAAALIQDCGLKGYRVGGAGISEKHAGFAVNLGGATASDVRTLLNDVAHVVMEQTGIQLEPEVRIW